MGEGGNVAIWESSFYISLELKQYKSETHFDKLYIISPRTRIKKRIQEIKLKVH